MPALFQPKHAIDKLFPGRVVTIPRTVLFIEFTNIESARFSLEQKVCLLRIADHVLG